MSCAGARSRYNTRTGSKETTIRARRAHQEKWPGGCPRARAVLKAASDDAISSRRRVQQRTTLCHLFLQVRCHPARWQTPRHPSHASPLLSLRSVDLGGLLSSSIRRAIDEGKMHEPPWSAVAREGHRRLPVLVRRLNVDGCKRRLRRLQYDGAVYHRTRKLVVPREECLDRVGPVVARRNSISTVTPVAAASRHHVTHLVVGTEGDGASRAAASCVSDDHRIARRFPVGRTAAAAKW